MGWFFVYPASKSNGSPNVTSTLNLGTGWEITLRLKPLFPDHISGNLQIEVLYPDPYQLYVAREDRTYTYAHSIRMEAWDGGDWMLHILPKLPHVERPSHVLLRVKAPGFDDAMRNTGILQYKESHGVSYASMDLDVVMKPRKAPQVVNAVRTLDPAPEFVTYEVTISNPTENPISITDLIIINQVNFPSTCAGGETYEVELHIEKNVVTGFAKRRDETTTKRYPVVKGQIGGSCGVDTLSAGIPISQDVPARQNAYITIRINAESVIKRSNPIYAKRAGLTAEGLRQQLKFRWNLSFVINRALTISTGPLYEN